MGNLKVRAFVVQKGKVVASGLATAESAQGSEPVGEANLAEAKHGLSKAYYAKHPTTLKDVEERWGKPIAVKKLKNGKEERYYKHVSPSTGYRAFLVQDGKVVASGITNIE